MTEQGEELRQYGHSKDGGIRRQVMLGIVQTAEGLPLCHEVFEGNTAEVKTLQPSLKTIIERFPVKYKEQVNQKLTYELALLKRHKFGQRSEHLNALQISLLNEVVNEDIAGIETELDDALEQASKRSIKRPAKRKPLPPELPRKEIHHEPDSTECRCGCQMTRIGEDISEKLDYVPGVFSVERHIRGKWVCDECETLTQAPMPAHVIDKGIPTTGLLAHLLISKYADHLPLYQQEKIFARAGVELARLTLAEWVGICGVRLQPLVDTLREQLLQESVLHADETPVPMLSPGKKKTHKAYI